MALQQVGFLEATTPGLGRRASVATGPVLTMRSGTSEDTHDLRFLDEFLSRLFPPRLMTAPIRGRLKGAIKEALLNVVDHAYDPTIPRDDECFSRRWWISGMARGEFCYFIVYDLGVGIPATVPHRAATQDAYAALGQDERKLDHELIRVAMSQPSSRTGTQGRGRGLPEMRRLIDRVDDGMLWITSGAGFYMYARGREWIDGGFPMNHALHGTLVVWRLKVSDALNDAGGNDDTIG